MKTTSALLSAALLLALAAPGASIVVRHDRDEADYRALAERYPATASILPDGTGVLIAPRWVLTAAHVARGVAARDPRVEIAGREHAVRRLVVHPEWSREGRIHDIALIELAAPVEDVTPVRLFTGTDETARVVTFVGRGDFGTGLTGPTTMDRTLRGATNVVESVDEHWVYFTFDRGADATELEGVSGPGDSGGPAYVEVGDELHTLGVSALAMGPPGRYGVREAYSRVSSYAEWIDSVLAGKTSRQAPD